jgi:hypothetical protein
MPVLVPGATANNVVATPTAYSAGGYFASVYVSTPVCYALTGTLTTPSVAAQTLPTASDAWGNSIWGGVTGGIFGNVISNCA